MKRLINALCYTHHQVAGYTHPTYSNGKAPRVRRNQPRWARKAVRIQRCSCGHTEVRAA